MKLYFIMMVSLTPPQMDNCREVAQDVYMCAPSATVIPQVEKKPITIKRCWAWDNQAGIKCRTVTHQ